jgi:hypothetical protein
MLMGANMIKGVMVVSLLIVHSWNILELFQYKLYKFVKVCITICHFYKKKSFFIKNLLLKNYWLQCFKNDQTFITVVITWLLLMWSHLDSISIKECKGFKTIKQLLFSYLEKFKYITCNYIWPAFIKKNTLF